MYTNTDLAERRKHTRAPIGVIVRAEVGDDSRYYYSENLSAGGIFLLAKAPPEAETRMRLEIRLPMVAVPLRAEGEVAWTQRQDPSGFAVRFTRISDGTRSLIRMVADRWQGQQE